MGTTSSGSDPIPCLTGLLADGRGADSLAQGVVDEKASLAPVEGIVSIWLALSPATVESGCMRMIPGSHAGPVQPHRDTYAADNILSRGQELAVAIDEASAVDIALAPGEMSLHHGMVFHASQPNRSGDRRIGFNAQYIAPHVRQTIGRHDSAVLVRGRDGFGHFEDEPRPNGEFEPAAVAMREALSKRRAEYLYAATAAQSVSGPGPAAAPDRAAARPTGR